MHCKLCFSHRTAKYTLLTFLPLNLLEQFRRVANAYFLIVLFLCYVMPSAPVDPNTWVTSVVFVFGITMVKQGYEDLRRYLNDRCDILVLNSVIHWWFLKIPPSKLPRISFNSMLHFRRSNHRPVKIIKDGNVVHTNSERICVGDIILLSENEVCPCDAVLLSSSHESHQVSLIQWIVN